MHQSPCQQLIAPLMQLQVIKTLGSIYTIRKQIAVTMSDTDRVNLPSTKRCSRPSSAIKRTKVSDSEVIHTIDQPQQLKDEHDDESSDAGSERPFRTDSHFDKADASKSMKTIARVPVNVEDNPRESKCCAAWMQVPIPPSPFHLMHCNV